MSIHIPGILKITSIELSELPEFWNTFPYSMATQKYGDEFVRLGKCCLLKVPSAVTKGDFNLIINPHHSDFSRIKINSIEPFPFDTRLFS